jgi:hypothetical protein
LHPSSTYNCQCERTFLTKEDLQQHERQHERDLPEHEATFEEVLQLLERASLARGATSDCKYCSRSFSSRGALHQHRCDSPSSDITSDCETSDSPANTAASTTASTAASTTTVSCKYCDRSFPTTKALHQHKCDLPARQTTFTRKTRQAASPPIRSFDNDALPQSSLTTPTSLQPAFHEEVLHLIHPVLSMDFFEASGFEDCIEFYDTHIMGRFACTNTACCNRGWSSKLIALTIRLYSGKRYNAVVWHQRCRGCETFGQPTLDDTYAERIAYRLKVWFRIPVEPVDYHAADTEPHEDGLCEGCKNRHCKNSPYRLGSG